MISLNLNEYILTNPHIAYELPMSKIQQAIKNNKTISNSWQTAEKFLAHCTDFDIHQPLKGFLKIYNLKSNKTQDSNIQQNTILIQQIIAQFGKPDYQHNDSMFDSFGWYIPLVKAIEFLESLDKIPTCIELIIDVHFHFIKPNQNDKTVILTNKLEKSAELPSNIRVILTKNSQIIADLLFPFENEVDLVSYLTTIQELLPFKKLDMKAFRRIYPNKQRTANVFRKILLPTEI